MTIQKLLIANRGEIAVRIVARARELGIATAQVYSKADKEQLAVRLANESVEIGPAQASKSYLNRDAILAAARRRRRRHPSRLWISGRECDFAARSRRRADLRGPTALSIRLMGDKVAAAEPPQARRSHRSRQPRPLEVARSGIRLSRDDRLPVMIKVRRAAAAAASASRARPRSFII